MPEGTSLLGFIVAALVVLLIPGPGVIYVVARSLAQGQRAGLISVLGLAAGALVHAIAAAIGLSAVLLASATAFGVIKFLGAAYLIYLGIRALLSRGSGSTFETPVPESNQRLFVDGVVISVFNPKIAVFFLAFLPQFVDPVVGSVAQQLLMLGLLYVFLAICTDGAYALFAGHIRTLLSGRVMRGRVPQYASGLVYIGLGVTTALSERR